MTSDPYRKDIEPSVHSSVLWALNKGTNDPSLRDQFANVTAAYAPGRDLLRSSDISPAADQISESLRQRGYARLPTKLDQRTLNEITSYFANVRDTDQDKTLTYYKISDICRAPHLLNFACSPEILEIVGAYLNLAPTVLDLSAWWTHPTEVVQASAQIPHRDRDDFKFCKLFVYLTDVGPDDGPHVFLPESHTIAGVEALCRRRGVDVSLVKNAFETNSRHQANWIVEDFGEDLIELTGAAGSMFFVNTFGYHFGKLPRQSSRFIFQVLYGQMGYGHRAERLKQTHDLPLPQSIAENPLSRYAARLLGRAV